MKFSELGTKKKEEVSQNLTETTPELTTKTSEKKISFLRKPKSQTKPSTKPPTKNKNKRTALWGTGITSRQLKRAEKRHEEDQKIETTAEVKSKTEETFTETIEKDIQDLQIKNLAAPGIVYDESQLAAIDGVLLEQFSCLIGPAGTGKTTTLNEILKRKLANLKRIDLNKYRVTRDPDTKEKATLSELGYGEDMNFSIAFCSFTGRAVQQMKRALPKEFHPMCATIHATLGYVPEWYDKLDEETGQYKVSMRFVPTFTAERKLPYDVIVIDEGGMLGIELWDRLWDACLPHTKIIIVGDIHQLPPVQGRSVLGFAMANWPTFELTKVHRQAADNPIIANAHRILKGAYPQKYRGKFDIGILNDSALESFNTIIKTVKALHAKEEFDPFTDGLIVPQNKDTLGQVNINERLTTYFNPERKDENGKFINKRVAIDAGRNHPIFAVGDKIMLLQNDNTRGLTNGMIGIVTEININANYDSRRGDGHANIDADLTELSFSDEELGKVLDDIETAEQNAKEEKDEAQRQASHVTTIKFDDGTEISCNTAGHYAKVTHAYAFTCHKSQGGEYPTVIIGMHSANGRMLSREWLYTAVTRAQERDILLCNERALEMALKNQRVKGKTLQDKIASFRALEDQNDVRIPNLPKARKL